MKYLPAAAVLQRYQISEMTLWRMLRDPELAFPQPILLKRRRLFDEEKLVAWERTREKGAA